MAQQGISFSELISSLSGAGSTSANLADLTLTGINNTVRPLTNYDSFGNHVFFGDAIYRFNNSLQYIIDSYPIGLSGNDISSLSAENVFSVDKWKKQAKGFDLWLLDRLGLTSTVTAMATNHLGEHLPLIWVQRNVTNTITGSQTAVVDSISAEAVAYEEEGVNIVNQTPGSSDDHFVWAATAEERAIRGPKLKNLLPEVLFYGDDDNILEKTLYAMADVLDDLKEYIDQIAHVKRFSYDSYDRIPDKFLPVAAEQFGINLYQSALNTKIEDYLVQSSSGLTTQEITYAVWNRIINNIQYLLKRKGTREVIEAIGRIYGLDQNFLKVDEYTVFNSPIQIKDVEEVDTPILFSTGDVYCQLPTGGSISSFDFSASSNFTIEARVSATSAVNHKILIHPRYFLQLNRNGQAVFSTTGGTSVSSTTSMSSFAQTQDNFVNIVASRTGDLLKVWVLGLSGSGSSVEDNVILASGVTSGVKTINFNSSAGLNAFGSYFPASGSFNGYLHELRVWKVALEEEDLKEHTRNFQSISFQSSTASNSATYGSLKAHYKLKEDCILTGSYNFIVDSTTGSNSAIPVNFDNHSEKCYRVFQNMKKMVKWYPMGLSVDNDKVRLSESDTKDIEDTSYVSVHMTPVNAINRDIKNVIQNLNVLELLGDPEDLYRQSYTGPIVSTFKDILTRYNGKSIADFNTFISAIKNFNDTLGGLFPFIKQFLPAKTNILSEGILIESPILENSKNKRQDYNTTIIPLTSYNIATHSNNLDSSVTAAPSGSFEGYKYSGLQTYVNNSISSYRATTKYTTNIPTFSFTKIGRIEPIKVTPADPETTELEVTVSRLLISPTASSSSYNGNIDGIIRLLKNGKPFKTSVPGVSIEFPSSSDGTNYFVAQLGDINNGKGRVIEGKDLIYTTNILSNNIQIKLQLANIVKSLSGDVTSLSGTVGIVPIRIVNLFNNKTQIIRLAIGNDPALVDTISNQGGVTIIS
jgi:hypothetical protein